MLAPVLAATAAALAVAKAWQLGPFTKLGASVLVPDPALLFPCPVRREVVPWASKNVLNPAAVFRDGKVFLLVRAQDGADANGGTSRIGVAFSHDGTTFEMLPQPVLFPDRDEYFDLEWPGGLEDPRIVQSAKDKDDFVLTYTAYDGSNARLMVATSSSGVFSWTKRGPVFPDEQWTKSGSIVCELTWKGQCVAKRIRSLFWMYFGDTSIRLAHSPDLIHWTRYVNSNGESVEVLRPRQDHFDSKLVEPGPHARIVRGVGIVLLYNSQNAAWNEGGIQDLPPGAYSAGQALLNASAPWEVLDRTEKYFLRPDRPEEAHGQVNNVVFVEGLVRFRGNDWIYFGTGDSAISVAKTGNWSSREKELRDDDDGLVSKKKVYAVL